MSYSTQGVQTRYLEAKNHSNNRTEFQIPDNIVALPSLRLINVGLFGHLANYGDAGVASVIKNLYLYSGSQLIDSLQDMNIWANVQSTFSSNDQNNYINRPLNKQRVGYSVRNNSTVDIDKDISNISVQESSEEFKGYINLGQFLPILLENNFALDTSRMKELRVVIDYDTNVKKQTVNAHNQTFNVSRPTLLYDEVIDDVVKKQIADSIQNLNFTSIERDSVFIDRHDVADERQSANFKYKFFDGKVVNKFLFMKQYNDLTKPYFNDGSNNNLGYGVYQSNCMDQEENQFIVNGKPVFEKAIKSDELRAYLCAKSWGFNNVMPSEIKISHGLDNARRFNAVPRLNISGSPQNIFKVGARSYLGFKVMDRIQSLQMQYSRFNVLDNNAVLTTYNEPLRLMLWAEVNKQFIISKEGILVRYL